MVRTVFQLVLGLLTKLGKVLHPYYKLAYIKLAWGGPEEQAAEIAAGNPDAKDWQDEAKNIVKKTASHFILFTQGSFDFLPPFEYMAQYYKDRPSAPAPNISMADDSEGVMPTIVPILSEFDKHYETLLSDDVNGGWASELRHYLGTMQCKVKKDTDLVEWWQVSTLPLKFFHSLIESLGPRSPIPNACTHGS